MILSDVKTGLNFNCILVKHKILMFQLMLNKFKKTLCTAREESIKTYSIKKNCFLQPSLDTLAEHFLAFC